MFRVYDKKGDYVDVDCMVDVKEIMLSGSYIKFEDLKDRQSERGTIEIELGELLKRNNISLLKSSDNSIKRIFVRCNKCNFDWNCDITLIIKCPSCNSINSNIINNKFHDIREDRFTLCECSNNTGKKLYTKKSRILTVIGTSETVRDDINKWGIHGDVAAINDAGFYVSDIDHFITIHGRLIPLIKKYRKDFRKYYKNDFITHTAFPEESGLEKSDQLLADFCWKFRPLYRSSGLLAIWIGFALDYDAVLAHGITMDKRLHFYDLNGSYVIEELDNFTKMFNRLSNESIEFIKDSNIRFSSGRFDDKRPTNQWITYWKN
jgi:hypothetical protein